MLIKKIEAWQCLEPIKRGNFSLFCIKKQNHSSLVSLQAISLLFSFPINCLLKGSTSVWFSSLVKEFGAQLASYSPLYPGRHLLHTNSCATCYRWGSKNVLRTLCVTQASAILYLRPLIISLAGNFIII